MKTWEKDSQEVGALVNKGIELFKADRWEGAIPYYDEALQIKPRNVHVLNSMAGAFFGLGKYKEAMTYCDKPLEIEPKNAEISHVKDLILKAQGHHNGA